MKIRIMGTKEECRQAQEFYRRLGQQDEVSYCSVSEPYPNRGSVGLYRVYVDIQYKTDVDIFGSSSTDSNEIGRRLS